jgi:hypothetical protein
VGIGRGMQKQAPAAFVQNLDNSVEVGLEGLVKGRARLGACRV